MRARHRHFNPRDAGAAFALDSRYGFNQSDNTTVSTWDDRTNNNADATQNTPAYRPKYRTAIQGGCPALQFDGVSNSKDRLDGSSTITNDKITTICVWRLGLGSGAPSYGRVVSISKNNLNDYDNAARGIPWLRDTTNNRILSILRGTGTPIININPDTWYHWASTYDGALHSTRLNESTETSVAASGNLDVSQYRIGMGFDSTVSESNITGSFTGYIAQVSLFNAALSASLRKRIQFANAFSYKLSCS
jgi:hypothetical protein